jgi:hypothetical protein
VALADSERLHVSHLLANCGWPSACWRPEYLHAPMSTMNARLLQMLMDGQTKEAAQELETYLVQSERIMLAAYAPAAAGPRKVHNHRDAHFG